MIQDIFDHLKTRYPESTHFLLGRKHLAANSRPPRIVLVPATELVSEPESWRDASGKVLQSIKTRQATLDVHFWGEDLGGAETLLEDFLRIVDSEASIGAIFGTAFWLHREVEGAGWLNKGEACVLPVTFKIPVLKAQTFATLTTITQPIENQ